MCTRQKSGRVNIQNTSQKRNEIVDRYSEMNLFIKLGLKFINDF